MEKFNQKEYINAYKKEHYKQINLRLKKDIAEAFDKKLQKENKTKMEVLLPAIKNYLEE